MFERAVAIILEREGPYANDAWDNGGETKWGVARNAHLDKFPKTAEGDARWARFQKPDALAIYREQYWDRNRLDNFPFPLALVMFDAGVQHGERTAALILQRIVRAKVDGVIGPDTVAQAKRYSTADVVAWIMALRVKEIYHDHEDWDVAGRGWIRRLTLVTIAAFTESGERRQRSRIMVMAATSDDGDGDGWENVSQGPHKPFHVQRNAAGAFRHKAEKGGKWTDGLPEGFDPENPEQERTKGGGGGRTKKK